MTGGRVVCDRDPCSVVTHATEEPLFDSEVGSNVTGAFRVALPWNWNAAFDVSNDPVGTKVTGGRVGRVVCDRGPCSVVKNEQLKGPLLRVRLGQM